MRELLQSLGQYAETLTTISVIGGLLLYIKGRIDARFEKIDARFEKIDERFNQMQAELQIISERLTGLNGRYEGFIDSGAGIKINSKRRRRRPTPE